MEETPDDWKSRLHKQSPFSQGGDAARTGSGVRNRREPPRLRLPHCLRRLILKPAQAGLVCIAEAARCGGSLRCSDCRPDFSLRAICRKWMHP